jgi:putative endonuclease
MDGAGLRGAVGRAAEERALRYLSGHGLTTVARNFRTRRGEVDLVMLDDGCLVFVEVRTRGSRSFVRASLTVDARKQRKLQSAALAFLGRYPVFRNHACRFDVIGIDRADGSPGSVQWVRDAFRPSA